MTAAGVGYAAVMRILTSVVALAALAASPAAVVLTPAEKDAARAIRAETMRAHVRYLASDLLEGRGPATRGDQLAEAYVDAQMERIGLEPGAPDGSWYQRFD